VGSDNTRRAAEAAQLLDNPLLNEAFDSVRSAAVHAWEMTKADDTQSREIAWLTVKVLARIKGELQSIVDDGRIAAARVQAPLR